MSNIHPSAIVHPSAKVAHGVTIEPFAVIQDDVEIGEGTHIMSNAVIWSGSRIGKNVKVFPGAVVGAIPQDLKFQNEYTTTEIGDNTVIREFVTIHKGTSHSLKTKVGSNCLLMCYVHVAHDCIIGDGCIIANSVNLAGHVIIDDFVTIEGTVAVQQFVRVGRYSFIAGGSLVRNNVPPFVKVAREPLRYMGVNAIGMERRGVDKETIRAIDDMYHRIFVKKQTTTAGIEEMNSIYFDNPYAKEISLFINESKAIIRGS
jgi:UDP-N-acetylglucosamine acyltransferase